MKNDKIKGSHLSLCFANGLPLVLSNVRKISCARHPADTGQYEQKIEGLLPAASDKERHTEVK